MSRSQSIVTLLAIANTITLAQQPIKVDLFPLFEKIVSPPASAKEAYEKAKCVEDEDAKTCVERMFKPLVDQLTEYRKQIARPGAAVGIGAGMTEADAKKLEQKSEAEQMKAVMEMMQKQMSAPAMLFETEEIGEALAAVGDLNDALSELRSNPALYPPVDEVRRLAEARLKTHQEIDDWLEKEIGKLPVVGMLQEADPQLVKPLRLKAADRHIAVVNEELNNTGKRWHEKRKKLKDIVSEAARAIVATKFGDEAKNLSTKQQFAQGQLHMLDAQTDLLVESQIQWTLAVEWYKKKVKIEREK
jgi:hypothetical protein